MKHIGIFLLGAAFLFLIIGVPAIIGITFKWILFALILIVGVLACYATGLLVIDIIKGRKW